MTSQGASIISFISLEFCLILLMTLGSQIGVPNRGPKSGSQTGVPNQGPKSGSHIGVPNGGVPNRGHKSGSQMGVPNGGVPNRGPNQGSKWGSQIRVQNRGPKWGSQIRILNRGPKSGSQIRVPNRDPKSGSQIRVPNFKTIKYWANYHSTLSNEKVVQITFQMSVLEFTQNNFLRRKWTKRAQKRLKRAIKVMIKAHFLDKLP
jgi:hypothetical protein